MTQYLKIISYLLFLYVILFLLTLASIYGIFPKMFLTVILKHEVIGTMAGFYFLLPLYFLFIMIVKKISFAGLITRILCWALFLPALLYFLFTPKMFVYAIIIFLFALLYFKISGYFKHRFTYFELVLFLLLMTGFLMNSWFYSLTEYINFYALDNVAGVVIVWGLMLIGIFCVPLIFSKRGY